MVSKYLSTEKKDVCRTCRSPLEMRRQLFRPDSPYCPSCGAFRSGNEVLTTYQFNCPHCGTRISFEADSGDLPCPDCLHLYHVSDGQVSEAACVLDVNEVAPSIRESYLVYRHPRTNFCTHTQITGDAGTSCLCVQGDKITVVSPDNPMPFSQQLDNKPVTATVFYIRNVVSYTFPCGTAMPILIHDDTSEAEIRFAVNCQVRVKDPAAFLRWIGFSSCTVQQLVDGQNMLPGLDDEIHNVFQMTCTNAVNLAVDRYGIALTDLPLQYDGIRQCLQEEMSRALARDGLTVSSCTFASFDPKIRGRHYDLLTERVERNVTWDTMPVRIHEKDHPELSMDIILSGSGQIRLTDRTKLLLTAEGNRWAAQQTDVSSVEQELGRDIGRQLNAVFQELVQKMINDVGASVEDVTRFLPYMQQTVGRFINEPDGIMAGRGLAVKNLTVYVKPMEKSALLLKHQQIAGTIASTDMDEKLRKYQDQLTITRARDESMVRIELKKIQQEEEKM